MIIHLLIISPIVEEYIFRKLFADKLLKYGELFYILTSSFCFSLVHLVPIGFSHVLYTFILGLIWSFAYIKTGNILVPIILHSLSNVFGSVLFQIIQNNYQLYFNYYILFLLILGTIGLLLFIKNRSEFKIENDTKGNLIKKYF